LEKDLGTLREYININLKKGFIYPSILLAGALIYFTLKKDGKLRLCINYHKLNAVTIKDQYALPLANKLRDQLANVKIIIKLDL
jgi:hypothetical protein